MAGGTAVLRRTLARNRARLIAGTVLVSLHQVAETAVPIAIGVIVDRAIETGDVTALVVWLAALAALFVVLTSAWRFGARFIVVAVQQEAHRLRVEVAGRILDPRGVRTDLRAGELLTVSTSDADREAWILDVVPRVAAALTALIASAIALLWIDVPLGLAVLIGTPVVLGLLQLAAPLITRRVTAQQETTARAVGMATDLVSGLRPLRGIGAEATAARRYGDVSRGALAATMRAAKATGVFVGVSTTVSALLAVAVAGFAGWFALDGRISVGELITVVGLAQFISEPLGMLARVPGYYANARASADRLALVLDAEPLLPTGTVEPSGASDVRLRSVAYRSLDGVTLDVAPGELLGIVAYRPEDAEALAEVLSGQVPPDRRAGEVRIGGVDVTELGLVHARRTILVEPHHTDLFAGTVHSNVTAGAADADHDVVQHVLRASAAVDVVDAHPDGLDHEVTDRGASLSGGQRQRVALARALAAQAPVLVLHDPTTAVDAVTEHAIADGIAAGRHGGTRAHSTILITSSPALLSVTDRVVVLADGRSAAEGTHAGLSATDENYRKAVLR
ncbi:putative ABC transport system ATP-binding protein [Rhodococcus sp. AG1013]|uniref:ABC transporter ATP-binding protein n=1 Tax=Rhodococcus sp. AG1013 TaxID=2183996 RepID=UPI000E0A961B|nr:ABC transporter ATP-binding protein [Rhodococcus sp. AG1013]RDI30218.1 putative ABC transport system ATP-binding protein [Rhodococcus sp. AG1013]